MRNSRRCALVVPIALVLLTGCGLVSRDEVARVPSPDGQVDAVLIETNGGATTSFGYEIHLVEKGRPPNREVAWLYDAGRSKSASGANLRWTSAQELVVEYLEARESTVTRSNVSLAGRTVHVSLRSGVSDPTAPSGGMLYNLERTRAATSNRAP